MHHHVTIGAVKLRERDEAMRCDRLHGIGYAWRCSCGERGAIHGSHRSARAAGREHAATVAGGEHAAP